jgi:tetratricopeptide (TPR) repeat protein
MLGRWAEAEAMWQLIELDIGELTRSIFHPGVAETVYALFKFERGDLKEEHLALAEQRAKAGKNQLSCRVLSSIRGEWMLEQSQWSRAAEYLQEAVHLAHIVGVPDIGSEVELIIAKFQLGELSDPRQEAERLSQSKEPLHQSVAELWLAIGNHEQAKEHALLAYKDAWADGEPYVYRIGLNKATALLEKLGVEIPKLPPYDPNKDEKLPWEDKVASTIEKLRLEKAVKESPRTGE